MSILIKRERFRLGNITKRRPNLPKNRHQRLRSLRGLKSWEKLERRRSRIGEEVNLGRIRWLQVSKFCKLPIFLSGNNFSNREHYKSMWTIVNTYWKATSTERGNGAKVRMANINDVNLSVISELKVKE